MVPRPVAGKDAEFKVSAYDGDGSFDVSKSTLLGQGLTHTPHTYSSLFTLSLILSHTHSSCTLSLFYSHSLTHTPHTYSSGTFKACEVEGLIGQKVIELKDAKDKPVNNSVLLIGTTPKDVGVVTPVEFEVTCQLVSVRVHVCVCVRE